MRGLLFYLFYSNKMTNNNQSIPEFENDNLLAKIFTSRKW